MSQFGTTQDGRDWCIKALHPSDSIMEVRGVPDQSAVPSTLLNFQQTFTISPAAGATGTFDANVQLIPDATNPACTYVTDTVGSRSLSIINRQLGTNISEAVQYLLANVQRHRLAYYGATVYLDAPALADQGSIVAYQAPVNPDDFSVAASLSFAGGQGLEVAQNGEGFGGLTFPSYTTGIAMPNAYTGLAKNGCYMPLKLSNNHQKWVGSKDIRSYCQGWVATTNTYGTIVNWTINQVSSTGNPPYTSAIITYIDPLTAKFKGERVFPPLNETWGYVCLKGMSVSATVRVALRYGIEAEVQPGTLLSPYLRLSPAYDRVAIEEYFAISRELKDAYPADYNDWGKLWSVIKGAANTVAPMLGGLGPIGGAIGALIPSVTSGLEKVFAPKSDDKPSAATVERERQAVAAAPIIRATAAAMRKPARPVSAKKPAVRKVSKRRV